MRVPVFVWAARHMQVQCADRRMDSILRVLEGRKAGRTESESESKTRPAMTRTKPLSRRTRLKPVSKKRREQNKEYARRREEFLKNYPYCKVCQDLGMVGDMIGCCGPEGSWIKHLPVIATEVHHMAHREGKLLLDARFFLPVCKSHHRFIHDNPEWAKQNGYLLPRR